MSDIWAIWLPSWRMPLWMQEYYKNQSMRQSQQVSQEIHHVINPYLVKICERVRIASSKSTKTLLGQCWFEEKDWVFPDFQWRTVLDIGWGFGWVAPMLCTSKCKKIIVVDPIFSEADIETHYQRDIELAKNRMNSRHDDSNNPPSAEVIRMRKENAIEAQKVFDELIWWKDYDPDGEHYRIKRNPSFWENIEWVPGDSQDYVFVKNVLFKDTVNPKKFIQEIHRVLRNGGCLILSDIFPDEKEKKQKAHEALELLRSILPYPDSNFEWWITLKIFKH